MPTNRFEKIQVQAMTDQPEPKPQAVVTEELAAKMAERVVLIIKGNAWLPAELRENLKNFLRHEIVEIEAQAKREPTLAQERLSQFEAYALPNVAIALDRIE